jgi:hypothetical protein
MPEDMQSWLDPEDGTEQVLRSGVFGQDARVLTNLPTVVELTR